MAILIKCEKKFSKKNKIQTLFIQYGIKKLKTVHITSKTLKAF